MFLFKYLIVDVWTWYQTRGQCWSEMAFGWAWMAKHWHTLRWSYGTCLYVKNEGTNGINLTDHPKDPKSIVAICLWDPSSWGQLSCFSLWLSPLHLQTRLCSVGTILQSQALGRTLQSQCRYCFPYHCLFYEVETVYSPPHWSYWTKMTHITEYILNKNQQIKYCIWVIFDNHPEMKYQAWLRKDVANVLSNRQLAK